MRLPTTTASLALAAVCAHIAAADALDGIGSVRLKGRLGARLDAMVSRHVAAADVDYITAPVIEKTETRGWWQTEFWGKWMHSAVPYAKLEPQVGVGEGLVSKIERGIGRILASQEEDGYIGNYPDELRCGEGWDVWGMKYTLMGLLHYHDLAKDAGNGDGAKKSLDAAMKLCDYVIGELGPGGRRGRELWQTGNWSGYASSSILEPVVWLYNRTGEKKYLDFAEYIVKGMTVPENGPRLLDLALKGVSVADRNGPGYKPDGEWAYVCRHGRSKAYEMMSCYQGLLEYWEAQCSRLKAQGEELENIRRAAVTTAEDIVKEEVNLAGGCACSEAWFHGAGKQHLPYERLQETCVTTTWMRFCEKLLDVTGDTKWADQLERTFYNAYLGALKSDGSEFEAYTPLSGNRWHGMNHCFMHTDCCTANGPRGFLCFLRKFFRVKDGAAEFNFYGSALVNGSLPDGRKVAFDMYSLYPRAEFVRIVSHAEGPVAVRLRIPAWSEKTAVKLNGSALGGVRPGGYFTVDRVWKLGDVVEIAFDMPVVAHVVGHHAAFTRGPVLLARDSR
ncbi:MAG: glycoside hydrolase family 127 protein, partial [Kiritimatiellae bacterium]|nr:glycoside hydrolase family 127 protein [Kiritimatiellia bacterium]